MVQEMPLPPWHGWLLSTGPEDEYQETEREASTEPQTSSSPPPAAPLQTIPVHSSLQRRDAPDTEGTRVPSSSLEQYSTLARMAAVHWPEDEYQETEREASAERQTSSSPPPAAPLQTIPVNSSLERRDAPETEGPRAPESSLEQLNAPPAEPTRLPSSFLTRCNEACIADREQRAAGSSTKRQTLPHVDWEAKISMLNEICAEESPSTRAGGPRHPRIHTLIGQEDLIPPPRRGTPATPAENSQWRFNRRLPLISPRPPSSPIGPVRRERTRCPRDDPYAASSRTRARGP
ncbi:hypothetical protein PTTG_25202 [Puccinia triticina 1-1 BBBD Race 1]|uniref:Uncharacterized protein n=1 Tax=Puccinia triticina (isolate 1-1 / race 1 (BBBD)) TaxID=630390 RepID=A0A180H6P8_PUCT1|nr:hypothetical protein PTTG_25202 [Puccinia triticina 1-1 BBBD Race 1]